MLTTDQQRAVAGGLHATSVGGRYPWAPVYLANGAGGHWEAHNLQNGQKLRDVYGNPMGAPHCRTLLTILDRFLDGEPGYVAG